MAKIAISEELKATLVSNPNIKNVHFTEDGQHHFNVFDQVELSAPDPKTGKRTGKKTGKKVPAGSNKVIVETLSREEVLAEKGDGGKKDEGKKSSK